MGNFRWLTARLFDGLHWLGTFRQAWLLLDHQGASRLLEDETDGTIFRFSGKTSENERFEPTATFQEDDSVRAQGQAVAMFRPPDGQPVDALARLDCRSIW